MPGSQRLRDGLYPGDLNKIGYRRRKHDDGRCEDGGYDPRGIDLEGMWVFCPP
jgi:hypothetical protein